MKSIKKKMFILFCVFLVCSILNCNTENVFASTPKDENFNDLSKDAYGSLDVNDLTFTSDGGEHIEIIGCDVLGPVVDGFEGSTILNDYDGSLTAQKFSFTSNQGAMFKLESFYAMVCDNSGLSCTSIDIYGYNGESSEPVASATDIDLSKPDITTYAGGVTYTRNNSAYDDWLGNKYGGMLVFDNSWYNIDTIVITSSESGKAIYLALDSIDLSNLTDISIDNDITVNENQNAVFTVNLTKAYKKDITVDYTFKDVTDGSPKATNDDYKMSAGTVTIPAFSTSATIEVPITSDGDFEEDENFLINISNPSIGGITKGESKCTILDDDTEPKVSLSSVQNSISENGGTTTVTATLSNKSYQDVTVNLDFTGAAAGTEYTASSTSILIPAGSLSNSIDISAVNNNNYSGVDKTLTVDINNVVNGDKGVFDPPNLVITDDDTEPQVKLSVSGTSISENGSDKATLTATLSNTSYQAVTVNLAFSGAGKDTDFSAGDSIVIPAGTLSNSIDITGVDNTVFNSNKTLNIDIASVTNGSKGDPTLVTVTLINDEAAPDLSINDITVSENSSAAEFTVSLSKACEENVTVEYNTSDGTATIANGDYTASNGTLTIHAGDNSAVISVPIINDGDFEDGESFHINISNSSIGVITKDTGMCTISDDDSKPTATLSLGQNSISENGGTTTVTATLSNKSYQDVTVNLDFTGAAAGTEYTASSTSILIPAGSLSNSIDISGVNNNIHSDGDKTLTVDINNVINGDKGIFDPPKLVIADDDSEPQVKLSVSGTSISENGSDKVTLTATLSNMSYQDVTVNLAFSGTAKDTDFSAGDSIVIPAGTLSNSIDITGVDNTVFNSNKTLTIAISSVTNGSEGDPASATVTIINDEAVANFSINDITVGENSSGAEFTVSLSKACEEDVTVEYNTSDGTATIADGDYTASNGTLTIHAGDNSAVISVPIINDGDFEGEENFHINISNPSIGVITKDMGMCTISDDDSKPTATLSLGQNSISENGGTTTVTATLSNKSYQDVTVNLDFTGAAAGTEYTASSTSILIPAGSLSNSIDISAVNNNYYSGVTKTLTVDINNVVNGDKGVFDPPSMVITDDDFEPQVKLSVSGPSISENGSDKATLTATLSNMSYQDVTVNLTFSGTAKDTDFSAGDSIVIPAGTLSNSIDITGIDNTVFYPDKTLKIDIASVTNGTKGDPASVTVNIINDEAAPDLSINDITAKENSSKANFTVSLSKICGEDITVEYNTSDGTATIADGDYTASNGTLKIPAGKNSAVISVPIINDGNFEGEENFHINILNPSIGIVTKKQGVCTIEDNDLSVKIYGNGNEIINGAAPLQTNGTVFDKPDTAGGTVTHEFTIQNIGGSDLSGLQIELDISQDFSVTSGQAINLAAGASTTFAITFKQSKSEKTATVTVKSNGSDISPFEFTIKGEGISYDSFNPQVSTSPTQVKETIDIDVGGHPLKNTSVDVQNANNTKTTTVNLDETEVQKTLNEMEKTDPDKEKKVIIPVTNNSDKVVGELKASTLKAMADMDTVLEIKTENASYSLPANVINIDEVVKKLGGNPELKDISVKLTVTKVTNDKTENIKEEAAQKGLELKGKPVEFEISFINAGKEVTVSSFNHYVERTVAIPDGVDQRKITTGVVCNPDGSFTHVPTAVTRIDGKYYAKINSLTNSTYALIYNPLTFKDVEKHWSKAYANDAGSRLIVSGTGNGNFTPDRAITRAEFAVIIVKALGLRETQFTANFMDVSKDNPFYSYICTAYQYRIITGYTNGKFGPNDLITREQSMTMISKAMKIAGMDTTLTNTDSLNKNFSDSANISKWAKDGAAICVNSGLFVGNKGMLNPKNNVTRAESATVIIKLLQKAGLI